MTQAITRTVYDMRLANIVPVPHEWMKTMRQRIDLAYDMGETPEMLAEELRFRYEHRPQRSASPRELAQRIVRMP